MMAKRGGQLIRFKEKQPIFICIYFVGFENKIE